MIRVQKIKGKASNRGFTIVELLITIVIIALLSTIVFVSYRGITGKANEAAIQSDLTNASKKLAMYYAEYGVYPSTAGLSAATNWCPTLPKPDNNYCLKFNSNTTAVYTSDSTTYTLNYTNNSISYEITNNKSPYNVTIPATTPIAAIGAITGTAQVGQTLTAGAVTPAGATVSYQWQSATTAGGTYANIPGATGSAYVVSPSAISKYIKVVVTGTGSYSGVQVSANSSQVPDNGAWLTVGAQAWARSNLNVGTMIADTNNQTNNSTVEKYCYSNNESNCSVYGGLYQWDEVMNYSTTDGAQGICPAGSHIATDNDWKVLETQLGMAADQLDLASIWRGTTQGTQLKSGGSSGLNLPLAGFRNNGGGFYNIDLRSDLWTSSQLDSSVWIRGIYSTQTDVLRGLVSNKIAGFSVRCIGN